MSEDRCVGAVFAVGAVLLCTTYKSYPIGAGKGPAQLIRAEFDVMSVTERSLGTPQPAGAATHLIERILSAFAVPQLALVFKWYLITPEVEPELQFKGVTPLAKTTVPAAFVIVM
ncbi:hypothetical protein D3C86_1591500 [compost metagenome]